jgi:hypothetical protein
MLRRIMSSALKRKQHIVIEYDAKEASTVAACSDASPAVLTPVSSPISIVSLFP